MSDLEIRIIFLEQTVAKMVKELFGADYHQMCQNARRKVDEEYKNV